MWSANKGPGSIPSPPRYLASGDLRILLRSIARSTAKQHGGTDHCGSPQLDRGLETYKYKKGRDFTAEMVEYSHKERIGEVHGKTNWKYQSTKQTKSKTNNCQV